MIKNLFALLRMVMFTAFVPALVLSFVACEPEYSGGVDNGGEGDDTEDTTSEIAVTGLVDKFGCTYADISGFANLNLLPLASGNPVIGIEMLKVKAENNDSAIPSTTGSLIGNIFTVSFSNLSPATEYNYRSFVTYGGNIYYGEYKTFATKAITCLISTGEVSDIRMSSAVVSSLVQIEHVDPRDNVYVGVAWSLSESDFCADGDLKSTKTLALDVTDGVYSASLGDLSEGTTYYYASFTEVNGVYVFSSVKTFTTKKLQTSGAVDLGLSVKWAACNVGADSPEDYGGYYAWGEIEEKDLYDWATYKWSDGGENLMVKYCTNELSGVIDGKSVLDLEDDIAYVIWGSDWRMPTQNEVWELRDKCTWERTLVNGVNGYLVTGPNGNAIFLPSSGICYGTDIYNYRGSRGYYWSASLSGTVSCLAYYLKCGVSSGFLAHEDYRYLGFSVRPVTE